jgi:hypothetical protein
VEGVSADGGAGGGGVALDYLHVADCAKVIIILIFLFFDDDIPPGYFDFGVFEEVAEFVVVDAAVGDDVPELFVVVGVAEEEGVVGRDVEYF